MMTNLIKKILSRHIELEGIKNQLWAITDKEMAKKLLAQLKEESRTTGNRHQDVFQRYRNQILRGISPLVRPKD